MKNTLRVGLLIVAISSLCATRALAQRWGSGPQPRAGVCFYEDKNFRGRYFCAQVGEDLRSLPAGFGDHISSIRVLGDVDVTVFRDRSFRGASARFSDDVRNLKSEGWNDEISSIRIGRQAGGWFGRGRGRGPVWGRGSMPREGACFYRDSEFRGEYFCVPRGASYALVPPGFNDEISSIRLIGAGVMVFADRDFSGRAQRITSSAPRLRSSWGDHISSLRVF
jgi:hypothetical protein